MKNGLFIIAGYKFWYKNDHLHNENGPALEFTDGYKAWYYEGQSINCNSQKEFETCIKRLVLL